MSNLFSRLTRIPSTTQLNFKVNSPSSSLALSTSSSSCCSSINHLNPSNYELIQSHQSPSRSFSQSQLHSIFQYCQSHQHHQFRFSHAAYRSFKSQESKNKITPAATWTISSNSRVSLPSSKTSLLPHLILPKSITPFSTACNLNRNPFGTTHPPLSSSIHTTTTTIAMPQSNNPHCAPVLQTLLDRNQGWADQTKAAKPELLEACSKGQAPKVLWIGCSDSRVPESMVTQSQPGEVFVTRNIANQFNPNDDNAVSVLTYAVEALGVEHVVIVGHESCGGVAASLAAARSAGEAEPPKPEGALQRHLSPLVKLAQSVVLNAENKDLSDKELVQKIAEASVVSQMKNVAKTDVMERNWKGEKSPLSGKVMEKVTIHGWIHDINTGRLRDLNVSITPSAHNNL